jgi:biopolymer transport protein ExbD
MSILRKQRKANREEDDPDMVPVMNLFLVLIPFLLMSASFYHLKAINTSVPVLSEQNENMEEEAKKEIKLTVIVEIKEKQIDVSALSGEVEAGMLKGLERTIDRKNSDEQTMKALSDCLEKIKSDFPASDTVIIIPEEDVVYDTIIQTMDVARYYNENPLFPKVVLSGKVG